ncbi:hypothetical protein HYU40_03035 [Candidatus Woesearchaeota archaeon]|nr:hypothetical protein [Candidatus Woesearchaeota archaeon]
MNHGKSLRPLYFALAGVALAGSLASVACAAPPDSHPTLEATVAASPTPTIDVSYYTPVPERSPTPAVPYRIPTPELLPTRTPTPTPTRTPAYTPTPTPTPTPADTPTPAFTPSPTPTATPSLPVEVVAKATLEELIRSNKVVDNYEAVRPIAEAVIGPRMIPNYDKLKVSFLPPAEFNPRYCGTDGTPTCIGSENSSLAFAAGHDVFVRNARPYQAINSTLREMLISFAFDMPALRNNGDAAARTFIAEILGNLGNVAAMATLAEMFGYDPHYNIADTPENRAFLKDAGFATIDERRAAWLVLEDMGFLDRSKPERRITAEQAWKAYMSFYSLEDPYGYAQKLFASHDRVKDSEWERQVLQFRLKPNKQPTELDSIILKQYNFYFP